MDNHTTDEQETEADLDLAAAIDWANSIQLRQAEKLMGAMARNISASTMPDPVHQERVRQLASDFGIDTDGNLAEFQRLSGLKLTELDEPIARRIATDVVGELLATMAAHEMTPPSRKILVSTLASGEINALCAVNTWDTAYYHVFVDTDLQTFCLSMAKIIAECLTSDIAGEQELKFDYTAELRAKSDTIQRRAFDLFASTILTGSARASEPWLPRKEALPLMLVLEKMLSMFPLSHELAHLQLGHLDAPETQTIRVAGFEDFDAQIYSHAAEFEADSLGAILANHTAIRLKISNGATILAPYIFLKSIELLDAFTEMFFDNKAGMAATHPSATDRARKIRDVITMQVQHITGEIPVTLTMGFHAIDRIFLHLLAGLFLQFQRLKVKGTVPRERVRLRESERGERPAILGLVPIKDAS